MQNSSADFEIKFYEGILKKKPDFIEALVALAELYTQKGLYQEGLDLDQRLVALRPEDPIILYNLACSYSLLNDIDASFEAIRKAISLGYDNVEYLKKDDDLKNLRDDKRFQKYILEVSHPHKDAKKNTL